MAANLDGLEATRVIREELPAARRPRIVAMTAAAFPEDRARCLEAGMDDYVAKPVGMEDLAAVLQARGRASGDYQRVSIFLYSSGRFCH